MLAHRNRPCLRLPVQRTDSISRAPRACAARYWESWAGGEDRIIQSGHVQNVVIRAPEAAIKVYSDLADFGQQFVQLRATQKARGGRSGPRRRAASFWMGSLRPARITAVGSGLGPAECCRPHRHSTLKKSTIIVVSSFAFLVMWKNSCNRKLLFGPWPMIRKLFTNVDGFVFNKSCVTPVP